MYPRNIPQKIQPRPGRRVRKHGEQSPNQSLAAIQSSNSLVEEPGRVVIFSTMWGPSKVITGKAGKDDEQ